jgi:hypothetical protein
MGIGAKQDDQNHSRPEYGTQAVVPGGCSSCASGGHRFGSVWLWGVGRQYCSRPRVQPRQHHRRNRRRQHVLRSCSQQRNHIGRSRRQRRVLRARPVLARWNIDQCDVDQPRYNTERPLRLPVLRRFGSRKHCKLRFHQHEATRPAALPQLAPNGHRGHSLQFCPGDGQQQRLDDRLRWHSHHWRSAESETLPTSCPGPQPEEQWLDCH